MSYRLSIAVLLAGALLFPVRLSADNSVEHDDSLLAKYAPVWVQEIGREPAYDIITAWDFDGNFDGYDNVRNADKFALPAAVYGSVAAETVDAYYLFYGVYHVKDYDTPLREYFWPSSAHDNDFEGAMIAVSKADGSVLAVETWYHSIFLQFTHSPYIYGNQAIDGAIRLEDGTHPILFVDAKGHGVRGFQKLDEPFLQKREFKIYRHGDPDPDVRANDGMFVGYEIITIRPFLEFGRGPFLDDSMFSAPDDYGLGGISLGKYLSGKFKGDSTWARPKPPWSWTDKFDVLRPGAWFFHPARVFNLHFGLGLSERYVRNDAARTFFDADDDALDAWVIEERDDSFFPRAPEGPLHKPYIKVKQWIYRLIEPIFFYFS